MIMPKRSELDEFIRRGPTNGDVAQGLAELRYRILTDGIPSNSDGMVRVNPAATATDHASRYLTLLLVRIEDLHLAHPSQRNPFAYRHLPRPRPTGCITGLQQDTERHLPHPRN